MLDLINDMEKCYAVFGLPAATMNGDSHQFFLNVKTCCINFFLFCNVVLKLDALTMYFFVD